MRRIVTGTVVMAITLSLGAVAWLYYYAGVYGFNVVMRRGGSIWTTMEPDDPRLTPSMRMAMQHKVPEIETMAPEWKSAAPGFETAEMPVIAAGKEVDRLLLVRIDPNKFRIALHNHLHGSRDGVDWLKKINAAMIINGGYFGRYGEPTTPSVINGISAGPKSYSASHGALVVKGNRTWVADLQSSDWRDLFKGAQEGVVSYPMLVRNGISAATADDSKWLANRSFIATNAEGMIIMGTTKDAFFSLQRFAKFLATSPLKLEQALNLDGGPLACQTIAINDFKRDFCGDWETQFSDGKVHLLGRVFGSRRWALVNVIAVYPK